MSFGETKTIRLHENLKITMKQSLTKGTWSFGEITIQQNNMDEEMKDIVVEHLKQYKEVMEKAGFMFVRPTTINKDMIEVKEDDPGYVHD